MRKSYILIFIFILSCKDFSHQDNRNISREDISSRGVNVDAIVLDNDVFNAQLISNGKVEASKKSNLRFKINERISSIRVKNSQKVSKGQVLATLDNEILNNQLDKAVIDFNKSKKKLLEEKINFGFKENSDKYEETNILNNLKIKSGYFEAQNELERVQLLYNQSFLKAPFDGVVANIDAKSGSFINSNDVFCMIFSQNKMEVTFFILESELSFIKKNQKVIVSPFSNESRKYFASVTEINPVVDKDGFVSIKARIESPDNDLFEGMNVKITINQPISNITVVPKEALVIRSNREIVFTIEKNLAKWNYVKVLDENSTSYAISEGLKIGDTVIVSRNNNLAHDVEVKPSIVPGNQY